MCCPARASGPEPRGGRGPRAAGTVTCARMCGPARARCGPGAFAPVPPRVPLFPGRPAAPVVPGLAPSAPRDSAPLPPARGPGQALGGVRSSPWQLARLPGREGLFSLPAAGAPRPGPDRGARRRVLPGARQTPGCAASVHWFGCGAESCGRAATRAGLGAGAAVSFIGDACAVRGPGAARPGSVKGWAHSGNRPRSSREGLGTALDSDPGRPIRPRTAVGHPHAPGERLVGRRK